MNICHVLLLFEYNTIIIWVILEVHFVSILSPSKNDVAIKITIRFESNGNFNSHIILK